MSTSLTPAQLAKLPKWAAEHIADIEREREVAIRALNEYVDNSTPSAFSVEEMECTGERAGPSLKKRYIQTRKIMVEHLGVELHVDVHSNDSITLQWGTSNRSLGEVAMIPESFQRMRLVPRAQMRD